MKPKRKDVTISKYNLIKFILDVSYEDKQHVISTIERKHCTKDDYWTCWLYSVSKIFNNKMPMALLKGLHKKNNHYLNDFCNEKIAEIQEENRKLHNLQMDKKRLWELKRDEGNKRMTHITASQKQNNDDLSYRIMMLNV